MIAVLIALLLFSLSGPATLDANGQKQGNGPPPAFDKRPFDEAKKAASLEKKWLIVEASAEWCGPCERMENTTWRDEKVIAWLAANAIAVQFDVDTNQPLTASLKIEAMPTVIALKAGDREFDRIVGYKTPSEFLAWAEGIARGETSLATLRTQAVKRDSGGEKIDISARLNLARALQQSGKPSEAAAEYVWLWHHALEYQPSFFGVRLSFMASDMERLAARSEGAKKAFLQLRDEAGKMIAEEKAGVREISDWIILNRIVGDQGSTLAWFDAAKEEVRWQLLLERLSFLMEELLIREKRWADFGKLNRDPIAKLESAQAVKQGSAKLSSRPGMSDEERKMLEESSNRSFRTKAGRLYAGLLAAGREEIAADLARRARELDDAPAMTAALVSTALDAGQARKEQIEWLTSAVKSDGALKSLLQRAENALSRKEPQQATPVASPQGVPAKDRDSISFDNVPLFQFVLEMMRRLNIQVILVDPNVKLQESVTLHLNGPVSKQELVSALNDTLRASDAVLVKSGDFMKIVPRSQDSSLGFEPVTSPAEIVRRVGGGNVNVNYHNASISGFLASTAELLNMMPVVISPAIRGRVSLFNQAGFGMTMEQVYAILNTVMKDHGARIIESSANFQIVPVSRDVPQGWKILDRQPAPNRNFPRQRRILTQEELLSHLISRVEPVLVSPDGHRLTGTVQLEIALNDRGELDILHAVEGPPVPLAEAVVEAVRQWRFKPFVDANGAPQRVSGQITMVFNVPN